MRTTRILAWAGLLVVGTTPWGYGGSAILVEPKLLDFGRIRSEDVTSVKQLRGTFTLRNQSGRELKISRVWTSCGCAGAKPSVQVLAPHGSITVDVDVDLLGASGKNRAQAAIEFGDGEIALMELAYDVEIGARLYPLRIKVRKSAGETAVARATAYLAFPEPRRKEEFPKTELRCSDGRVAFRKVAVRVGSQPNEVDQYWYASVDFEAELGADVGDLEAVGDLRVAGESVASVPIIIEVRRPVALKRDALYLGNVAPTEAVGVELTVLGGHGTSHALDVEIEGLVVGSVETEADTDGESTVRFQLRFGGQGFSARAGVLRLVNGDELPFEVAAYVRK